MAGFGSSAVGEPAGTMAGFAAYRKYRLTVPRLIAKLPGNPAPRPVLLVERHYRLLSVHFELIHSAAVSPFRGTPTEACFQPSKWLILNC